MSTPISILSWRRKPAKRWQSEGGAERWSEHLKMQKSSSSLTVCVIPSDPIESLGFRPIIRTLFNLVIPSCHCPRNAGPWPPGPGLSEHQPGVGGASSGRGSDSGVTSHNDSNSPGKHTSSHTMSGAAGDITLNCE